MEIHYCAKCRSRVTSLDIETGKAGLRNTEVFCEKCARQDNIPMAAAAPAKPRTTISAAAPRPRSERLPSARGAQSRGSAAGMKPVVVVLILIILVAGGVAVWLLANKKQPAGPGVQAPNAAEAPVSREQVAQAMREANDETAPAAIRPAEPVTKPEPAPELQPTIRRPEPAVKPPEDGETAWGEPVAISPFGGPGRWAASGGKYSQEGDAVILTDPGVDLMYRCTTDRFILEFEVTIQNPGGDSSDSLNIFFPRTQPNRGGEMFIVVFETDGTIKIRSKEKEINKTSWQQYQIDKPINIRITVIPRQIQVDINDRKKLSAPIAGLPDKGGFQFSPRNSGGKFRAAIRDIRLTLPK